MKRKYSGLERVVLSTLLTVALLVGSLQPAVAGMFDVDAVSTALESPSLQDSELIEPEAANLALAMGVPEENILSAGLVGSDVRGVAVQETALGTAGFPSEGESFAILSTGIAAEISDAPSETVHDTELDGANNAGGYDMVRLYLQLAVPDGINCAAVDFAFYSDEFPKYVGTSYNDTFSAQINQSNLSVEDDVVTAAGNFAFDANGAVLSVNASFDVDAETGTSMNGGTAKLRATTPVDPGSTIDLYFTVQDLGDSILDSAVFLDNFVWTESPTCEAGAVVADPVDPVEDGFFYVDVDATGSATGESWGDAFTNLQDALAIAGSGTQIWVAAGAYYPDIGGAQTDGDRLATFLIPGGVAVYGGFDPDAGVTDMDDRNPADFVTVLSGDVDQDDATHANNVVRVAANLRGANSYHVVTLNGSGESGSPVGGDTVIDGFVITAGQANGEEFPNNVGGGLYCNGFGGECSPTLSNLWFYGNAAAGNGGAVFNDGRSSGVSNPVITNVGFAGNQASFGGALYNYGGTDGDSSPTLVNVLFSGNLATSWGGAILNQGESGGNATSTVTNATFSGNRAELGGAIYNYGDDGNASPTLNNVILWGNGSSDGASIYNRNANLTLLDSIIELGTDGIAAEGPSAIAYTGNSSNDPLFIESVDPATAPTDAGDLSLRDESPAVDAGNSDVLSADISVDLSGGARIVNGLVDIGAYEFQGSSAVDWGLTFTLESGDSEAVATVWSPDGGLIGVGTEDGRVLIIETVTGEVIWEFTVAVGSVTSLTWSPTGTQIAAGTSDGTIGGYEIWDVTIGESVDGGSGDNGGVLSITWSSDGRWLVCGLANGNVLVYDVVALSDFATLEGAGGPVYTVSFSSGGGQLVAGTDDGSVIIWEVTSWEVVNRFSGGGTILSIAWSPDGTMIVCAFANGLVVVSNAQTGETVAQLQLTTARIENISWSPDGGTIGAASLDGVLYLVETRTYSGISTIESNTGVFSISWSPNGGSLVCGLGSGTVEVWRQELAPDPQEWTSRTTLVSEAGAIFTLSWSPNGEWVAAGSENGTVLVWEASTQEVVVSLTEQSGIITSVVWSPDGSRLAAGAEDGTVIIWETTSWTVVSGFQGEYGAVLSIAWSPDGSMIVCGIVGGVVVVGDTDSGEEVAVFQEQGGDVTSVLWSPDGQTVATGSLDGTVYIWSSITWEIVTVYEDTRGGILDISYTPFGDYLACAFDSGIILVADTATEEVVEELEGDGVFTSIEYSPDGGQLGAGSSEGTVFVWPTDDYVEPIVYQAYTEGPPVAVEWSPDGTGLSTGSLNGTVEIWNTNVDDLSGAPAADLGDTSGYFRLQTMFLEGENRCLEGNRLDEESVLAGAAFQDVCQNVTGQLWKVEPAGDGYYRLQTLFLEGENKCLEGNRVAPESVLGGAAFLDTCQRVSGQLWKFVDAGGGYYRMQTQFLEPQNRCLEGNRTAPASVLEGAAFMDTCQNVTGQYWKLVPASLESLSNAPTTAIPSDALAQLQVDVEACRTGLALMQENMYALPAAVDVAPPGRQPWLDVYNQFRDAYEPACQNVDAFLSQYQGDPALTAVEDALLGDGVENLQAYLDDSIIFHGSRMNTYCPALHLVQYDCETGPERTLVGIQQMDNKLELLGALSSD